MQATGSGLRRRSSVENRLQAPLPEEPRILCAIAVRTEGKDFVMENQSGNQLLDLEVGDILPETSTTTCSELLQPSARSPYKDQKQQQLTVNTLCSSLFRCPRLRSIHLSGLH